MEQYYVSAIYSDVKYFFAGPPQTAKWVEAYARNSPLFFKDFAAAYSKLLALGTAG